MFHQQGRGARGERKNVKPDAEGGTSIGPRAMETTAPSSLSSQYLHFPFLVKPPAPSARPCAQYHLIRARHELLATLSSMTSECPKVRSYVS